MTQSTAGNGWFTRRTALAGVAVLVAAGAALAQGTAPAATPTSAGAGKAAAAQAKGSSVALSGNPMRDNLAKLMRPISRDFTDARVEDVLRYFADETGVRIEPLWKDDITGIVGLDKEKTITISFKDQNGLRALEQVLEKAGDETGQNPRETATWQMTDYGSMQVSTRERLNKYKRVEIYDIKDLLFVIPVHNDAPQIDLQQVLQSGGGGGRGGGGGGGGRSPFGNNNQNRQRETPEQAEQRRTQSAERLRSILTTTAEKDQWEDSGGTGGTITYFEGNFIINAPDYMHRAVNGYRWWPSTTASTGANQRRFVMLNLDTAVNQLDRPIRTVPIPGVVPGGGG